MQKNTKHNNLSMYQQNTIDLTTERSTKDNPVYLIDRRLLDELLLKISKGNLEDLKAEVYNVVALAENKDHLFERLEHYIYMNGIINVISDLEDKRAIDSLMETQVKEEG